jgi:outer membrane protein assembly factor BamD (BamD/ComL family)
MKLSSSLLCRVACLGAAILLSTSIAACKRGAANLPTAGDQNADKFLFDRGTESLARHRWLEAREYFRKLFDTYPTSG